MSWSNRPKDDILFCQEMVINRIHQTWRKDRDGEAPLMWTLKIMRMMWPLQSEDALADVLSMYSFGTKGKV